jgi:hypothetical protein
MLQGEVAPVFTRGFSSTRQRRKRRVGGNYCGIDDEFKPW